MILSRVICVHTAVLTTAYHEAAVAELKKSGSLGIQLSQEKALLQATARQTGFSLAETASAMGVLRNNGLEADKALVKLVA